MAQRANLEEFSPPLHEAYACILSNGLDVAGEALRIMVNEASRIKRAQHLQAVPSVLTKPMATSPRPCSPVWAKSPLGCLR